MKIRILIVTVLSLFFYSAIFAQEYSYQKLDKADDRPVSQDSARGKVEVFQDSRVDSIVKMHIDYNKSQEGIMGYRVQIFFDAGNNSLEKANAAVEQFQTLYPSDTAYISFSEPYYKVRIGDFRTRLEAEGHMQKVLSDYPNAFVIKDKIRFPELY